MLLKNPLRKKRRLVVGLRVTRKTVDVPGGPLSSYGEPAASTAGFSRDRPCATVSA